jgi:phospholipase/carboxylesterase
MFNLQYYETEKPKKIENLFIFIHGFGANGQDLLSLAPYFQKKITNCHFITPDAPYKTDMHNSFFWFPLHNFAVEALAQEINKTLPILENFIDSCKEKYQVDNSKIILLGFSQGAALAIHYGIAAKSAYKAILSFSGGALAEIKESKKNNSPICLIHGLEDSVLPAETSKNTANILNEIKHPHQIKLIPNLAHNINIEGLEFSCKFLENLNKK